MIDLNGRTALITGASRGIGRACALRLARLGANVAVNYLVSRKDAVAVVQEIQKLGRQAIAIRADVAKADDVSAMVEATVERFGSLHVIVSNAAAGGFHSAADLSLLNVETILRTNSLPVLSLTQAAAPYLSKEAFFGKVIAISSHGSRWAVPSYAAIGASKAALESLVRHLALEFGPLGINFNCVLPGLIPTEAVKSMPDVEQMMQSAKARMMIPDRSLTDEDVAGVVAFLASPHSDLIQGQTIVVDGGISVRI